METLNALRNCAHNTALTISLSYNESKVKTAKREYVTSLFILNLQIAISSLLKCAIITYTLAAKKQPQY